MTSDEMIEAMARAICTHWQFQQTAVNGSIKWVKGGNSLKQQEARDYARTALEAVAPMIRAVALEQAAMVVADHMPRYDTDTRDPESLMQALAAQDALRDAEAAIRAMKEAKP